MLRLEQALFFVIFNLHDQIEAFGEALIHIVNYSLEAKSHVLGQFKGLERMQFLLTGLSSLMRCARVSHIVIVKDALRNFLVFLRIISVL